MLKSVRLCLLVTPGFLCVLVAFIVVAAATPENLPASLVSGATVMFLGAAYMLSCAAVYVGLDFREAHVSNRRDAALKVTIGTHDLQEPRDAAERIHLEGVPQDQRQMHDAYHTGERSGIQQSKKIYGELLRTIDSTIRETRNLPAQGTLDTVLELLRASSLVQ